ncbi:hypothetical protein Tco_1292346 [Tanacetum coccineum]
MKNRFDGVKAKPQHHRDPLITHTLRIILIPSILCVDFILDNKQKAKEHKRAILLILRGALSIREMSLNGISLLAKTLIKHSLTPSVPTPSLGLNGEIFFVYNPNHLGVRFRLGGEQKEISLLELGWRIGLYFEGKSRENATLSRLRDYNTVKESRLLLEFWPTIRDGGFNVGNTKRSLATFPMCAWLAIRAMEEEEDEDDDEGDEAARGGAGHEEAGGSTAMYRNTSQGDWQVHKAQ